MKKEIKNKDIPTKWFRYFDEGGQFLEEKEFVLTSEDGEPPYTSISMLIPGDDDVRSNVEINLVKLEKALPKLRKLGIEKIFP